MTGRRTGALRVPEGREAADIRTQRHGCERREGVAPGEDSVQRRQFFIRGLASKLPEAAYEGTYSGTATASDRALYDFDPTGISLNTAAKQPVSTRYYSMEGAQIATPAKGAIVLKSVTYADGERRVTKEIVK